uniref:Uncharacterized protein n=1 Tax=Utricularia reniformis TaxID=192314 RepID=A0A1Y0B410_9LAMI|nr:hypothetical protein AEK19_MT1955 [Utricularia reniformis]ART32117.1 hypothetical protein AEK19_MT1955 [Utricularia reniformis]
MHESSCSAAAHLFWERAIGSNPVTVIFCSCSPWLRIAASLCLNKDAAFSTILDPGLISTVRHILGLSPYVAFFLFSIPAM